MLEEVDFTKEAQHLAQFSAYLDRAGLRRVATCPSVYRQFSSKRWVPFAVLDVRCLCQANYCSCSPAPPSTASSRQSGGCNGWSCWECNDAVFWWLALASPAPAVLRQFTSKQWAPRPSELLLA